MRPCSKEKDVQRLDQVPLLWQRQSALHARLQGSGFVIFLDYDGTLTPIVKDYTKVPNVLYFNPRLPEQLDRLSMRIRYRRQILDVEVDREVLRITSRRFTAAPITVACRGQFREMSPGDSYSFRLIRPPRRGARCEPRRTLAEPPS